MPVVTGVQDALTEGFGVEYLLESGFIHHRTGSLCMNLVILPSGAAVCELERFSISFGKRPMSYRSVRAPSMSRPDPAGRLRQMLDERAEPVAPEFASSRLLNNKNGGQRAAILPQVRLQTYFLLSLLTGWSFIIGVPRRSSGHCEITPNSIAAQQAQIAPGTELKAVLMVSKPLGMPCAY